MLAVYIVIIAFIAILSVCTVPYKRNLRKKLNQKEYPLKCIFGAAMFLTDKILGNQTNKSPFLNKALRELKVKEDIKKDKYLYVVSKMAFCLAGVSITMAIGIGIEIAGTEDSSRIKSLKRDSTSPITYNIYSQNEKGEKKALTIDVEQKELKEEDTVAEIKNLQKELVKKVLGKNKSAEYVTEPLNLVSSIGEDNILISWNIDDSNVIAYDGQPGKNIPDEGRLVKLTAIMNYKKVSVEYSFNVNVFPKKSENSIQSEVQSYVDNEDIYSKDVRLPEEIKGEKITYFSSEKQNSILVIIAGVLISGAMFFLKDNDIKKQLKERNRQLSADYPEIVSKLLLYHGAGLSVKTSIEKIVNGYEEDKKENTKVFRYAYEELEIALIKMKSGMSEATAVNEYGKSCGLHCYIKLSGIIEQNIKRGTNAMSIVLKNELANAMLEKKNTMLKEGGQISTKLMGPMVIMLVITMTIIMVPAIMSMHL